MMMIRIFLKNNLQKSSVPKNSNLFILMIFEEQREEACTKRNGQMKQFKCGYFGCQYNKQIYSEMARTKQTARKAFVGVGKGAGKVGTKIKKPHRYRPRASKDQESDHEDGPAVNTQQFSLKFDDQSKCEESAVRCQLYRCGKCDSILTIQSQIIKKADYKSMKEDSSLSDAEKQKYITDYENVWICEFCLFHNSIPTKYKPPKEENPCLILDTERKENQEEQVAESEKMLIFCIDISGSMDYNIEGKTRLESVKEAIIDELNRLNFEKTEIKVGLITFGSYVTMIGDAKYFKEKVLDHGLYSNFDGLISEVKKIKNFCHPLLKSYQGLKKRVGSLKTLGSTALGPALLTGVELASQGAVGSKVILCTDGEANVGMGGSFNMDRFTFYSKVAEYAKKKRVNVNILSLKGDRCNLKELGKLSLATGGAMLKIDPKALGTEFSKIVKEDILGSESKLVVKLNKIFQICNGNPDQVSKDLTTMTQDYGNFSAETQLTFQFSILTKEDAAKNEEIDLDIYKRPRVPMQIQLQYVGRKGESYLQVVTDWRELTENEKEIYDGANFGLFAASVLQRASQKIKKQEYKEAESLLKGYWSLVKEKFEKEEEKDNLQKFNNKVKDLERVLASKMKKNNIPVVSASFSSEKKPAKRTKAKKQQRNRERSRSIERMASDSEEQILHKYMRARSRSRSRSRDKKPRASSKKKA